MSNSIYIDANLKALVLIGLWDYYFLKSSTKATLFNIYGKVLWIYFAMFIVTQLIDMYTVKDEIELLMQNCGVTLLYIIVAIRTYSLLFRKSRWEKIFAMMKIEEMIVSSDIKTYDIYLKYVDKNWWITKLFWRLCFSIVIFYYVARPIEYYILGPQEEHNFKFPLIVSSWFPFNKYASGYYEIAYGVQAVALCIGSLYVAVTDTLVLSMITFPIGQFKIIQYKIKNLKNDESNDDAQNNVIDVWAKIVDIVKHHCRILRYISAADSLLNPIIFIHFMASSMLICAVGLEGIIAGIGVRFVLSIHFLMGLVTELFLFYWNANEVTLQSSNLSIAFSESNWYQFSARSKFGLLMILLKSRRPSIFSVGGFIPMSLNSFLMVLRGAYSFLMLFWQSYHRN